MTRKERRAAEHAARKAAYKTAQKVAANAAPPPPQPESAAPSSAPPPPSQATPPPFDPLNPFDPTVPCQPEQGVVCGDPKCPACSAYFNEKPASNSANNSASTPPKTKPPISEAQHAANRRNSQKSTGPAPENLHKISQNALKHGLTGRVILLPWEDETVYEAFVQGFEQQFEPVGIVENHHVQNIIDAAWRLERVVSLEYATLFSGRLKLFEKDPTGTAAMHPVELERLVRENSEKALRNLQIQEQRLLRRRERETTELRLLQEIRHQVDAAVAAAEEKASKQATPKPAAAPKPEPPTPTPKPTPTSNPNPITPTPPDGFVFANSPGAPETFENPSTAPPNSSSPTPEPMPNAA